MILAGDTCLLQYHIEENCQSVEFDVKSHGNRKTGKKPFYPMQRSTMEAMKRKLSNNSPSVAFKNVASESGGVMGVQNPGQLPRSRQQLSDVKFKMNKSDQVDELLLYSKQKDETVLLEHHDIPDHLWILGKPHMCQVFANDENAILESEDKQQLETRLKRARPLLDEGEKRLTATSSPKFGVYLSNKEKMMSRSMIKNARKKDGMPTDKMGIVLRSYTNQSETVINKLTRQREAITGKAKSKSDLTKLEFVRDVWEQVDQQQQLELQLAICGLSEEYELADQVHYLLVNPEV